MLINFFEGNKYIYRYTDHLGNIRLSYAKNGSGKEIIEENNFYPFGLKHEGYNIQTGNSAYIKKVHKDVEFDDGIGTVVFYMNGWEINRMIYSSFLMLKY